MKICEIEGFIRGFEFNSVEGFVFNGVIYTGHDDCYSEREVSFPYNVNKPKQIDLKTIRDKEFKLTIEIIEDEED